MFLFLQFTFSVSPATHIFNQFDQIISRNSGALSLGNDWSRGSQDAFEWRSPTCARERNERVPFVCRRREAFHEWLRVPSHAQSISVPDQLSRLGTRCQRPGHLAPTTCTALPQRHESDADSHVHLLRAVSCVETRCSAHRMAEKWNSGTLWNLFS